MGVGQTFRVDSWEGALAIVRYVRPDAKVMVPKQAEPALPEGVAVRRSNVPWSIHKGARRVYRENRPGTHVQIREYDDHWTVERDQFNPRYRPVEHLLADTQEYSIGAISTPVQTTTDLLFYGPPRSIQLVDQLTTDVTSTAVSTLDWWLDTLVEASLAGTDDDED